MFGPIKNLVFDFDGTLVDSMSIVVQGLTWAIAQTTSKNISKEELVATFGPPPREVLSQWVPQEKLEAAHSLWLDFENKQNSVPAFAGVNEMLQSLLEASRGLCIFTGRDRPSTEKILSTLDWVPRYFNLKEIVCGDDGMQPKPHPEALLHILKLKNWKAEESLMVGDHPYDMIAGRQAGMKTAAALWDLPVGQGTQRSRFKEAWTRWDTVDCDLRLTSPLSLKQWVGIV